MQQKPAQPDRTLIAILSVIAVIVVVALVVVFTRGGPANIDPTTPAGVVQSYTRAMVDSDYEVALDFLSSDARESCDRAGPKPIQGLRMTVVSSSVHDNSAAVQVSIERGSGDFGSSEYETEEVFTMIRENELWKIDTTPWELALCRY